jgi:hypothetical protein
MKSSLKTLVSILLLFFSTVHTQADESKRLSLVYDFAKDKSSQNVDIYSYAYSKEDIWAFFSRTPLGGDMFFNFLVVDTKNSTLVTQISDKNICGEDSYEDSFAYLNGTFFKDFIDKYRTNIDEIVAQNDLSLMLDHEKVYIDEKLATDRSDYVITIKTPTKRSIDIFYKDEHFFFSRSKSQDS